MSNDRFPPIADLQRVRFAEPRQCWVALGRQLPGQREGLGGSTEAFRASLLGVWGEHPAGDRSKSTTEDGIIAGESSQRPQMPSRETKPEPRSTWHRNDYGRARLQSARRLDAKDGGATN